jgi:hypothetical protein
LRGESSEPGVDGSYRKRRRCAGATWQRSGFTRMRDPRYDDDSEVCHGIDQRR